MVRRLLLALPLFFMESSGLAGFSSPPDWRDITVYQVVTDRFFNADSSNDNAGGSLDPNDGFRTHGGDFQGLTAKLDYIAGLGVDAIWISPVVLNAYGEYHGYAARDFGTISPQMGGLANLQVFVAAAHARGLYVIIDVVTNHFGDLIDSGDPGYPDYRPGGGYTLRWRNPARRPAPPFDDLSLFHDHGRIQNFDDPEQVLGELFSLDDLRTEDQAVRDALVDAYVKLVEDTDCDGFRIDTVKHVDVGFWQDFLPRMRQELALLGKSNFLMFGEVFDGNPAKVGLYTGTMAGGPFLLDSATWFPMTFAARWLFSGAGAPADLTWVYGDAGFYDPVTANQLGNFFDNHDIGRLASFELANQDDSLLRPALVWLLSSTGIPIIYYGTEQEFDGGGDPWNREDMWDGGWDFGPSEGDSFDMTAPLYVLVRRLQDLRHELISLRRGEQTVLWAESSGPGGLAYRREDAASPAGDVLVVLNTALQERTSPALATRWSAGTVLTDRLDSGVSSIVDGTGAVTLPIGARGAMVFTAAATAGKARVVATWPEHDGELRLPNRPARIVFDRAMDASVVGSVAAQGVGALQVDFDGDRTVEVVPTAGWFHNSTVTLTVDAGALAVDGTTLDTEFSSGFRTVLQSIGVTVNGGFQVEAIDPFGLKQPRAVEVVPSGWMPSAPAVELPMIGDRTRERVLRLLRVQHASTLSADDRLTQVDAMDGDPGAAFGRDVLVASGPRILRIDGSGSVSDLASLPGDACGLLVGGEDWEGHVLVSVPSQQTVYDIDASGIAQVLPTGLQNPRGLDQAPPGHPERGAVFVCDPTVGGPGSGAIYRLDDQGNASLWLSHPDLDEVMSIAFAPAGSFGLGNLYALDVVGERILTIDAARNVTVFAEGFHNLYGADALAMGHDDDLYVTDPGGSEGETNTNGSAAAPRIVRIVGAPNPTTAPEIPIGAPLLEAPVPNPANPEVTLRFRLPRAGHARLAVHDAAGRRVAGLLDELTRAGETSVHWRGQDDAGRRVASGVYYARLSFGGETITRKLALVQ